ncbi:MAG: MerC domain-containing protein [Cytophagia bacterium]|nr:MAG: MerC domain-containing protein [Cytophagia bacterium]TAG44627.1 MAG: MerC domain-containing protein [Cytophagia bacterium]
MRNIDRFDFLGVISASLCAVHCVLTPFLIVVFAQIPWLYGASYVFLMISFVALFETSKHKEMNKILSFLWFCFALLAVAVIFEEDFHWLHYLNYLASAGLIIGHILNIKYCQECKKD